MLTTVAGVYRDGKVELVELPGNVGDGTDVLVTFLAPEIIDLRAHGIDEGQARDLRAHLAPFAEDWDSPEMDVYDNYDGAKTAL